MHQPADISRQLLGLRTGKHQGVVERMQEAVFGNPSALLHQFLMHHTHLSGRAAKADEAQLQPITRRFCKRNCLWGFSDFRERGHLVLFRN